MVDFVSSLDSLLVDWEVLFLKVQRAVRFNDEVFTDKEGWYKEGIGEFRSLGR